jgi:hypothetical protein
MYYDLLRGEEQYVVVDIELEKVLLSIVVEIAIWKYFKQ